MKMHPVKRMLSMLLAVALVAGFYTPTHAASAPAGGSSVTIEKVDNDEVSASLLHRVEEDTQQVQTLAADETVRVSIVLEEEATMAAGFTNEDIAENDRKAAAYRQDLLDAQNALVRKIEAALGQELDVVWNLTLAANIISAWVEYGQIDTIAKIPGVKRVTMERTYQPMESVSSAEAKPNMVISAGMTGAKDVWDIGYYGAGTRVAVIDTGLDTDHQSFDPAALEHAFRENAKAAGKTYEEYVSSLDLLDKAEIAEKLPQLNLHKLMPKATADDLYVNMKAPFGVNYIDKNFDITHDNDSASEHGSHVSGISSANRFIKQGQEFVKAADTVYTLGNAPDSQIIVMKVFGQESPTDADYMAALEDAIVLGCDVANLSLGGSNPGSTISLDYENIMDSLVNSDTVVAIAAGNEGPWSAHASGVNPNLYVEDVAMQTASEPATFTNSLAVASVDNNGMITTSLVFNGKHLGYVDGKGDWHDPLAKLDKSGTGTEYDFVYLMGEGKAADYEGIDVTGKIVLVSRGDINFTDKAKEAVEHGAIATLVYNNVVDNTIMVMDGYWESEPCAMISKEDAATIKAGATEAQTEAGVTYYTGKITVDGKLSPVPNGRPYHVMSAFSSWGVPGDLSMKPEISAPGGNIYSVNGAVPETDQYEVMSGTSMATPQVAGLSALLMEHIHRNNLSQKDMTDRALAQSILMSTADPMFDENGRYISVLQQGSGLANIRDAVAAQSFVTVKGQNDGKVKAELGDDPARTGSYTFTFKVNNLTDVDTAYALSAQLFTQDTFEDYANKQAKASGDKSQMVDYMAYYTRPLASTAKWTADSKIINSTKELAGCDFDGNKKIDKNDAQALLDYATGKLDSIKNMDKADLTGDGKVNTRDAYAFLDKYSDEAVLVPANGSVEVTVTLTLTDEEKAYLNENYPNGAYVQGFVTAEGVADEEGVAGTTHDIPVLAFYGNWTDPSMFELGSIQEKLSGQEIRTTYTGEGEAFNDEGETITPSVYNTLRVEYFRDPGYSYLLGGNPVDPDETPNPQRTAINNQNGDKIHSYKFSPIRNAASSRVQMTDTEGKVLWQRFPGPYSGAYFGIMMFFPMWINSSYSYPINFVPRDLAEGESFTTSVTLAPEYNTNMVEEKADWDSLGHGATLSTTVRIDNTDPQINEVSLNLMGNSLTVNAQDNQYIAGVALFDRSGRTVLASTGSVADAQPGDVDNFTLSLDKAHGKKFLVQVFDYAYNVSTYELNMELGDPVPLPQLIAHDTEYAEYDPGYWTGFKVDSDYKALSTYAKSPVTMRAATMADPYIYSFAEDGALYVLHKEDLLNPIRVGELAHTLDDMAYSKKDGKIYVVYQEGEQSVLAAMDKLTGALTEVGKLGIRTNTLAVTADGLFYSNELGTSKIYKYTLDSLTQPQLVAEVKGDKDAVFESKGTQSMEFDPNTGNVVWLSYTFRESSWGGVTGTAYLYEIQPDDQVVRHNDMLHHLVALVIPDKGARNPDMEQTNTASALNITEETVFLMKSQDHQLTADILPWNASDRFVYWESDKPDVVSVDGKGYIEALGVGTATIKATSRLNPELTDTVTVHVNDIKVTVNGLLQDSAGKPSSFTWDLEKANDWEVGMDMDTDVMAATAKDDWTYYVTSGTGRTIKKIDFGSSSVISQWTRPMSDLAYSTVFSGDKDLIHMVYMTMWLPAKEVETDTPDGNAWDLTSVLEANQGGNEFVGIASAGSVQYTETTGKTYDAELLYLIDNKGGVLKLFAYEMDPSDPDYDAAYPYNAGAEYYPSDLSAQGYAVTYDNNDNPLSSLVVGQDGNLYFSGFNGATSELYQLTFNADTKRYEAALFADMGEGVWPVALTKVTTNPEPEAPTSYTAAAAPISTYAKKAELPEQPAQGSTKAFKGLFAAEKPAVEDVEIQVDAKDVDTNNGLLTVTYDPDLLTLKTINSTAALTSAAKAEGKVTFGYADTRAIAAGDNLLTLVFTPAYGTETQVRVAVQERNEELLNQETVYNVDLPQKPVEPKPEQPSKSFEDVHEDDWFFNAVNYVVDNGLFNGVSDTKFAPHAQMTRATLVQVLYSMAGKPAVAFNDSFEDVRENDWFASAVSWAVENGVASGVGGGRFAPNEVLDREQLATMLWARQGKPAPAEQELNFKDADRASDWAVRALCWAVENGLMAGIDGEIAPQTVADRAQGAVMLMQFHKLLAK